MKSQVKSRLNSSNYFVAENGVTRRSRRFSAFIGPAVPNAAAIYEYQADCDGEWGEISFDFENGTAEILLPVDWDTMKTNRFANRATVYLLTCENEKLSKDTMIAFDP